MKLFWRKAKKTLMGASALALSLGAFGCGSNDSSYHDPYSHAWFDVYGTYCYTGRPLPGCNFYGDGAKIRDNEDPYYSSQYLSFGTWSYTDSYGYQKYYTGYAWLSGDGILYDDYGYALNEQGQDGGRDLMAAAAQQEAAVVAAAAQGLQDRFALSADTSTTIAKTLNDWAVLGKKHPRTDADVAEFSKRLFGVGVDQLKPAIADAVRGNTQSLETLNNSVASYWNTSPETSKEILTGWYKSEIAAAQK